jgi:hypothetical protein
LAAVVLEKTMGAILRLVHAPPLVVVTVSIGIQQTLLVLVVLAAVVATNSALLVV